MPIGLYDFQKSHGLLRRSSNAAKMSESETGRIFQAITERTVKADMSEPNHARAQKKWLSRQETDRNTNYSANIGMSNVATRRSDSRTGELPGK